MKYRALSLLIAGLGVLGSADTAPAAAITFYFAGTIDAVDDRTNLLRGAVAVGTPFSGYYSFDPNAPDVADTSDTLAQYRSYGPEYGYVLTVGSLTFDFRPPIFDYAVQVLVGDDHFGYDRYSVETPSVPAPREMAPIIEKLHSQIILMDGDQTVFSSPALPLTPPPLEAFGEGPTSPNFNFNTLYVSGFRCVVTPTTGNCTTDLGFSGTLTELRVPEPTEVGIGPLAALVFLLFIRGGGWPIGMHSRS